MESCVMMRQGSHTLSSGKYFLSQSNVEGYSGLNSELVEFK